RQGGPRVGVRLPVVARPVLRLPYGRRAGPGGPRWRGRGPVALGVGARVRVGPPGDPSAGAALGAVHGHPVLCPGLPGVAAPAFEPYGRPGGGLEGAGGGSGEVGRDRAFPLLVYADVARGPAVRTPGVSASDCGPVRLRACAADDLHGDGSHVPPFRWFLARGHI